MPHIVPASRVIAVLEQISARPLKSGDDQEGYGWGC